MEDHLILSTLGHTWLLDLDGTIVKHNGYLLDGEDTFLSGAKEFLDSIPEQDVVVLLTSRTEEYRAVTEQFLREHGVRYHHMIFGLPYGERVLVNDNKPSGLCTARCLALERDCGPRCKIELDTSL
jgi:ribonucleotide monophosphatase NagD (HAD superfamily)